MKNQIQLATISILINGREKLADNVQKILTANSKLIMVRTGVNVQPKCVSDCLGLIMVAVQGPKADIDRLAKKINTIKNVSAKVNILAKQ